MTPREVGVRVDTMATGHAKRAAAAYGRDVLGPVARRVEAFPETIDGDDKAANEAALRRLLDGLDAGLVNEMDTGALTE